MNQLSHEKTGNSRGSRKKLISAQNFFSSLGQFFFSNSGENFYPLKSLKLPMSRWREEENSVIDADASFPVPLKRSSIAHFEKCCCLCCSHSSIEAFVWGHVGPIPNHRQADQAPFFLSIPGSPKMVGEAVVTRRGAIDGIKWSWVQNPLIQVTHSMPEASEIIDEPLFHLINLNDSEDDGSSGRAIEGIKWSWVQVPLILCLMSYPKLSTSPFFILSLVHLEWQCWWW